jgi:hypothetical protein
MVRYARHSFLVPIPEVRGPGMKLPLFLQPVDAYERHWVVARHFLLAILVSGNYWRVPRLEATPHEYSSRVYVFAVVSGPGRGRGQQDGRLTMEGR